MFCENCGQEIIQGENRCSRCGAPVYAEVYGNSQPQNNGGMRNETAYTYSASMADKISDSEKKNALAFIVFGGFQLCAGLIFGFAAAAAVRAGLGSEDRMAYFIENALKFFLAFCIGIVNIVYGAVTKKLAPQIYVGNRSIPVLYKQRKAIAIAIMVCNVIFSGIIGIIIAGYSLKNIKDIEKNADIFL